MGEASKAAKPASEKGHKILPEETHTDKGNGHQRTHAHRKPNGDPDSKELQKPERKTDKSSHVQRAYQVRHRDRGTRLLKSLYLVSVRDSTHLRTESTLRDVVGNASMVEYTQVGHSRREY